MNNNYIGFDYKEIETEREHISFLLDGYENFGWKIDENLDVSSGMGKIKLHFKRDRKIINKTELTRLQRQFEDCIRQIQLLESSKGRKATAYSISIGILGTACMAGSVFSIVGESPIIWLCILLAIPGFLGWIFPYVIYKKLYDKRKQEIAQLIEDKYDEIHVVCEKGSNLLLN